jgi:hypothetical protein
VAEDPNYAQPISGRFLRRVFEAGKEENEVLGRAKCAGWEMWGIGAERETVEMEAACIGIEVLLGKIKKIAVGKRTAKRIKVRRGKHFEMTDVQTEVGCSEASHKLRCKKSGWRGQLLKIRDTSRPVTEKRGFEWLHHDKRSSFWRFGDI